MGAGGVEIKNRGVTVAMRSGGRVVASRLRSLQGAWAVR